AKSAYREKFAFRVRNSCCRERTTCLCVIDYRRGLSVMSAIGPPQLSAWRSRGSVIASSAPGECAVVQNGQLPQALPSLSFNCEYRFDLVVLLRLNFNPGSASGRDRLPCVEINRIEWPLFRRVQMLEKCCRSARKCNEIRPSKRFQIRRCTPYVVLRLA